MIRESLFALVILLLAIYAWKDWFKAACGLVVLMAVIRHEIMPSSMFGVTGLNPWNLLFLCVIVSFFAAKRSEGLRWDLPTHLTWLLVMVFVSLNIALLRTAIDLDAVNSFTQNVYESETTVSSIYIDYLVSPLKWTIPSLLIFMGCNSVERFRWAMISMLLMYVILSLLVIRWMPLGLLVDGDALQRRAARVLGRDVGYYRTNLSIMLAGAAWMAVALGNYFKRWSLLFYGVAGVITLAMLLTGGRAGWGAWAALSVIMIFTKWRRYLIFMPIVILVTAPFIPASVYERMLVGLSETEELRVDDSKTSLSSEEQQLDELSAGRSLLWPEAVDQIVRSLFFGYGFYGIVQSGVSYEFYTEFKFPYLHPHNAYLQLLLDNGVIGSIPFLLFFFLLIRYSWRLFRESASPEHVLAGATCFAMVFVFLVGGVTGQSFYPEERSFGMWWSIGLMLRAWVEYKRGRFFNSSEGQALGDETPERFKNHLWGKWKTPSETRSALEKIHDR